LIKFNAKWIKSLKHLSDRWYENKSSRAILISIFTFSLFIMCFLVMLGAQPRLPQAAIILYLELNSQVRKINAVKYVEPLVQQAHQNWENAQQLIKAENNRFPIFRTYHDAEKLILKANDQLRTVVQRTQFMQESLKVALNLKRIYLWDQIDGYQLKFDRMPIATDLREHIVHGELLLRQGEYLLDRKEYPSAVHVLDKAAQYIANADANLSEEINNYLSKMPTWQQWIQETLAYSRNSGKAVIIIDKLEHLCRVFQEDSLLLELTIEMGPNWIGTKIHKGDKRTPEGKYYITKMRQGKDTKFYKALQLNYPNEDDWMRYYMARYKGEFPAETKIGGLIEVHGNGGRGINWTDGCIAVQNLDMDKIFALVKIGTPVTIVGSTKNYQTNFNHSNNNLNY